MATGAAIVSAVGAVGGAISQRSQAKKALSSQEKATATATEATEKATAQARSDVGQLFGQAQQGVSQGFQGAANVFRDVVPQQSTAFQQGNINAQQSILAGLPQIQNALLGGNVNLGALQPSQQINPDFGFLNQFIPTQQQGGVLGGNALGGIDLRTEQEKLLANFGDLSQGQRLNQVLGNFGSLPANVLTGITDLFGAQPVNIGSQPIDFSGLGGSNPLQNFGGR
jgi:hypothetical protein